MGSAKCNNNNATHPHVNKCTISENSNTFLYVQYIFYIYL